MKMQEFKMSVKEELINELWSAAMEDFFERLEQYEKGNKSAFRRMYKEPFGLTGIEDLNGYSVVKKKEKPAGIVNILKLAAVAAKIKKGE